MSILDHAWGESPAADRIWALVAGMHPSLILRLRLVILQAFIDDSHDSDSGTYVLAGYVASVEQWAAFSADWAKLLPLATSNKNGVQRFKMSEMVYRGRMNVVPKFHQVISDHVQMSVACIVNKKRLREVVDRLTGSIILENSSEIELELDGLKRKWCDPFFFCFRALMDSFHKEMGDGSEFILFTSPVDFYFDREQANEKFIYEIWEDYLAHRPKKYVTLYGHRPKFEDEEEFLPLQAADFRAWWVRKFVLELGQEHLAQAIYPYEVPARKLPHIVLTTTDEQISRTVAEAIGTGIQEMVAKSQPLTAKVATSDRFWPRKPL